MLQNANESPVSSIIIIHNYHLLFSIIIYYLLYVNDDTTLFTPVTGTFCSVVLCTATIVYVSCESSIGNEICRCRQPWRHIKTFKSLANTLFSAPLWGVSCLQVLLLVDFPVPINRTCADFLGIARFINCQVAVLILCKCFGLEGIWLFACQNCVCHRQQNCCEMFKFQISPDGSYNI